MEDKARRSNRSGARHVILESTIVTALGVVLSLVSALISAADVLRLPMGIAVAVGAVLVTTAFTFYLGRRERGQSRVAKLKRELTSAYLVALDGSPLNPDRSAGR